MAPCALKSLDYEADDPDMVPVRSSDEITLRAPRRGVRPGLVLAVDDEAPVLRALRRILDADHHRVALASSPAEAARFLPEPALDVVLLDLVMGESCGLELLERVKRERPEVEVVVMTGHASVDSAVECMRRGAFDYLSKPFEDPARVRETVRRAIERRCRVAREGREAGEPSVEAGGSAHTMSEIPLSLDAYEKSALERALRESAGDAGAAARRLGIGRSTFYRKLAKHGIGDARANGGQGRPGDSGVGSHSSIR